MIIKLLPITLIVLGWCLYVLFDDPTGTPVRWPGVSLIVIGLLLIPAYHNLAFVKGAIKPKASNSGLYKLSILMFGMVALCVAAVGFHEGFDGLIWLIPASIFAAAGLLMLFASLFVKGKS